MERLTNHQEILHECIGCIDESNCYEFSCGKIEEAIQKLAYYEDMEEKGKLVILPCKPGDTVYLICSRYTKCTKYGEEFEESSCCGCEEDCDSHKEFYIHVNRSVSLEWIVRMMNYFGKTVFLTEQEAKEALAEMEGKGL